MRRPAPRLGVILFLTAWLAACVLPVRTSPTAMGTMVAPGMPSLAVLTPLPGEPNLPAKSSPAVSLAASTVTAAVESVTPDGSQSYAPNATALPGLTATGVIVDQTPVPTAGGATQASITAVAPLPGLLPSQRIPTRTAGLPPAVGPGASATLPAAGRPTALPTFNPALLTPTSGPAAASDQVFGIEVESISAGSLGHLTAAGAGWVRRNALDWSAVEPQVGARNWQAVAGLEQELARAASANLPVILVVRRTPAWAQSVPGAPCSAVKPERLEDFAAFMHDAVARYSVEPYRVRYWELGNEPDIDSTLVPPDSPFGCWGEAGDPYYGGGLYAAMLKTVYPQIKTANPQAQVFVGGLLMDCDPLNPPQGKDCTPSLYLEGILKDGGGAYFDGVSFHAYDFYGGGGRYGNSNWAASWDTTGPVVTAKTRYLRGLLAAYGYPGKMLINTEAGLLCGRDGSEPECRSPEFQQTKAIYMAQVNAAAQVLGLRANIWYSLSGWRGTALQDQGGELLPAYHAFRISTRYLVHLGFVREVTEFRGLRGYEFAGPQRRVLFLTAMDGQVHTIDLPAIPIAVETALGETIQPAAQIGVGAVPVFIELMP